MIRQQINTPSTVSFEDEIGATPYPGMQKQTPENQVKPQQSQSLGSIPRLFKDVRNVIDQPLFTPEVKKHEPASTAPKTESETEFEKTIGAADYPEGFVPEPKEGLIKSTWRFFNQFPKAAIGYATAFYSGLAELAKQGSTYVDPSEIQTLKERWPDFDVEGEVQKSVDEAAEYVPTLGKAFELAERYTGIPLEAKNDYQKGAEVFSWSTIPGNWSNKKDVILRGLMGVALYEKARDAGLPDPLAMTIGAGGGNLIGAVKDIHNQNSWRAGQEWLRRKAPWRQKLLEYDPFGTPPSEPSGVHPGEPMPIGQLGEEAIDIFERKREKDLEILQELEQREAAKPKPPGQRTYALPTFTGQPPQLPNITREAGERANQLTRIGTENLPMVQPAPPKPLKTELRETIARGFGTEISPERSENDVGLARRATAELHNANRASAREARRLYAISRELNSSDEHERRALNRELRNLNLEGSQSDQYKQYSQLATMLQNLEVRTRVPMSDQQLIDARQEFSQYINRDLEYNKTNIFYRGINLIDQALLRSSSRNPEGHEAFRDATNFYRNRMETFNNKTIRQYLSRGDFDWDTLHKGLVDPSKYILLSPIFEGRGANGRTISRMLKREIVENVFKPQVMIKEGDPDYYLAERPSFCRLMANFPIDLSQEEEQGLIRHARGMRQTYEPRRSEVPIYERGVERVKEKKLPKPIAKEAIPPKYFFDDKNLEQTVSHLESLSGIREANQLVQSSDDQALISRFKKVKKELAIRKITGAKTKEGKESQNSIANVLENVDDVEYLKECLGPATIKMWQDRIKNYKKYEEDLKKYEKAITQLEKLQQKAISEKESVTREKSIELLHKKRNQAWIAREIGHALLDTFTTFSGVPFSGALSGIGKRAIVNKLVNAIYKLDDYEH
jgi:hypothetical protein